MIATQTVCAIEDDSHIGAARRQAQSVAEEQALDDTLKGRVSIVANELATNIRRHAGRGEILMRPLDDDQGRGIELLAIDRGHGIDDVDRALRDGYSTGGTAGNGLGSIRRLATEFDLFSESGKGTVVFARIQASPSTGAGQWRWGGVATCAPGETVCGDAWTIVASDQRFAIVVADGLGHGPLAREGSSLAVTTLDGDRDAAPAAVLTKAHLRLHGTRGAAVAVARASVGAPQLTYSAVGNIAAMIVARDGTAKGLVTMNGTVGATMPSVRELDYPWTAGSRLIMHSDGIQTRWNLTNWPGLASRHPTVIAGVLHRDHRRGRDDATVVVAERLE